MKSLLDIYFPCTKCKASFSDEIALKSHFIEIHIVPITNPDKSNELEINDILESDQEPQHYGKIKSVALVIHTDEVNQKHQITNYAHKDSTIDRIPSDLNTDTINGSEKHLGLLEESCELLFNISSDFISSNLNSVSNIIKTEELQNSNINENFKTIGLIKTKESSLNTLRENYYFEESVKEEEDILTRRTTQFIKENMDSKVKSEKKKPHPSKIAAIKPKQPSLMKTHRQDLEKTSRDREKLP